MPNRQRVSKGRFKDAAFFTAPREHPVASAAAVAGAAGVAAASAYLWTRRAQIGEALSSGVERLSEFRAERMGWSPEALQEDLSEKAMTLKEIGRKRGPRGPIAQTGMIRSR